jgi:HEAT repeat protein
MVRELWDRRPENRGARALRLFLSDDPGERAEGFDEIYFLLMVNSLQSRQVDAAIPSLLVALRDKEPRVREKAMMSLFYVAVRAQQGFKAQPLAQAKVVPHVEAIVLGLMEAMRDPTHAVRRNAALAMALIYCAFRNDWDVKPPLPKDLDRFVDVLCQVIEDPDPETPQWAIQVLGATARRLDRAPPAQLVRALDSPDPVARQRAAETIVKFPRGIEQALPAMLRAIEREGQLEYRRACARALSDTHPSPAAIPLLVQALRSRQKEARFVAAQLLSRISPQAREAVPAVLPLLDERFEPASTWEREQLEDADPAVAATWALVKITRGTEIAATAEAAIAKLLESPEHPWRRRDAEWALNWARSVPRNDPSVGAK